MKKMSSLIVLYEGEINQEKIDTLFFLTDYKEPDKIESANGETEYRWDGLDKDKAEEFRKKITNAKLGVIVYTKVDTGIRL